MKQITSYSLDYFKVCFEGCRNRAGETGLVAREWKVHAERRNENCFPFVLTAITAAYSSNITTIRIVSRSS